MSPGLLDGKQVTQRPTFGVRNPVSQPAPTLGEDKLWGPQSVAKLSGYYDPALQLSGSGSVDFSPSLPTWAPINQ